MARKNRVNTIEKVNNLAKAIAGLEDGTYRHVREAARATRTPRTTLQDRLNGRPSKQESSAKRQTLTPEQELMLVKWVEHLACTGNPVHHPFLMELALEIMHPSSNRTPNEVVKLGKQWINRFLDRHPSIHSTLAWNMESTRTGVTEAQLQNWFAEFQCVIDENGILEENIYNMDETGIPCIDSIQWHQC